MSEATPKTPENQPQSRNRREGRARYLTRLEEILEDMVGKGQIKSWREAEVGSPIWKLGASHELDYVMGMMPLGAVGGKEHLPQVTQQFPDAVFVHLKGDNNFDNERGLRAITGVEADINAKAEVYFKKKTDLKQGGPIQEKQRLMEEAFAQLIETRDQRGIRRLYEEWFEATLVRLLHQGEIQGWEKLPHGSAEFLRGINYRLLREGRMVPIIIAGDETVVQNLGKKYGTAPVSIRSRERWGLRTVAELRQATIKAMEIWSRGHPQTG